MSNIRRNASRQASAKFGFEKDRSRAVADDGASPPKAVRRRHRCQHKRNDGGPRCGTGGGQGVQPVDQHHHKEGEQAEAEPVHRLPLPMSGSGMQP